MSPTDKEDTLHSLFNKLEAIELNILFDEGRRVIRGRIDGSRDSRDLALDSTTLARLVRATLSNGRLDLSRPLATQLLRILELGWKALEEMKLKGSKGRNANLYAALKVKMLNTNA